MGIISFNLPEAGEARGSSDGKIRTGLSKLKEVVNGELNHENLSATAAITKEQLASSAKPVVWYTPKAIATEQTLSNTSFGTLTTADEITGVVVPENSLLAVGYRAVVTNSVGGAGRLAVFIGSNQLKSTAATGGAPAASEVSLSSSLNDHLITSSPVGLTKNEPTSNSTLVTTGQLLQAGGAGGPMFIFLAPGTYAVSVKYRATSGSISSKNRLLWVYTLGV